MKNNVLSKLIALCLFITLFSCGDINKSATSNESAFISNDSATGYQATLSAREKIYSKKQNDGLGELLLTIPFEVRADDKKAFANGVIPWASIESPENDIPKLIDASKIVILESKVTIVIDYPLTKEYQFDVESKNGFTREQILRAVSSAYYKVYKDEERTSIIKTIPAEKRATTYNRNQTDGIYGVWGHDISDLVLAEVLVYKASSGKIILALSIES